MRSILVTGDFIVDHHLYEGRRRHYGDDRSPGVTVVQAAGGAALIHQLLRQDDGNDGAGKGALLPGGWQSHQAMDRPAQADPGQVAYALWRPQPGLKKGLCWRVTHAMGFGSVGDSTSCQEWPQAVDLPSSPTVLVISDGGMGFRKRKACWQGLPFEAVRWIVCKTELPDYDGAFWKKLKTHREKLVVVLTAAQLRKGDVRISKGLSWEATLLDLHRELNTGSLQPLAKDCAHLVISFETEAALWIDFTGSGGNKASPHAHFIFDPPVVENERGREIAGTAFGLSSCLAAGVVWSLVEACDESTPLCLTDGIEGGLSAMRDLLEDGHGPADADSARPNGFPAARLAAVIKSPRHLFSRSRFLWNGPFAKDPDRWSLLRQAAPDIAARARLVAIHGDIALQNVPHLQIGNLFTADRSEIESLRTLVQTLVRYKEPAEKGKKPLSIGVFGPPGSGKSFAVEEIAKRFFGEKSWLVFNLSQFKDETDLIGAFHQIRDQALRGLIPVAFFDEFDSQNLRWLQYLLAPMQDGSFQEGQITHPIGKCIFIFAGGTSFSFQSFTPAHGGTGAETEAEKHFRLTKGPDFSSRLDATLNVSGLNHRLQFLPAGTSFDPEKHFRSGTHCFIEDTTDDYRAIRRARMLRHKLDIPPDERLQIAPGLLHALLQTPRYTHGSRSLEKILEALKTSRPGSISPSTLPPPGQLGMHTHRESFLRLMSQAPPDVRAVELTNAAAGKIAPIIHETYRALGRRTRWLKKEDDVAFNEMEGSGDFHSSELAPGVIQAWKKESNAQAARRIPHLLALAGLRLDERSGTGTRLEAEMRLESLLELLARDEHERWMEWHYANGWVFNRTRDNQRKRHDQLLPYAQLNDENKNKDRAQVRRIPKFAAAAGLRVRPV